MLGFRPIRKQEPKQPQAQPPAPTRRHSTEGMSPPLPVIYEHRGNNSGDSSIDRECAADTHSHHSRSSSDGTSTNPSLDGFGQNVVWPPLHSPSWPPRDDEPLIRRWNEYGAIETHHFDSFFSNCMHGDSQHHQTHPRRMDSDATEAHSNRREDLHHNFNICRREDVHPNFNLFDSLNYSGDSGSNGGDRDGSYSFLNNSSFHRRHRVHTSVLRIWQTLSVLVMVVFCSSLFLMPSILEQSNDGQWGGKVHGQYDHHDVKTNKAEHTNSNEDTKKRDDKEDEWSGFQPWKYLFGADSGNQDDKNETEPNEMNSTQGNYSGPPTASSVSVDTTSTSAPKEPKEPKADQEEEMAAYLANVTFASLAELMLPQHLQTTIDLCKSTIIPYHDPDEKPSKSKKRAGLYNNNQNNSLDLSAATTSVQPSQVFKLRKQLLKTRDMIDVFAPTYPPTTESKYHEGDLNFETRDIMYAKDNMDLILEQDGSFHKNSKVKDGEEDYRVVGRHDMFQHSHNHVKHRSYRLAKTKRSKQYDKGKDLWRTIRKYLDEGYTVIGDFQDLDHAKIKYTADQLAGHQKEVWKWHVDFMTFMHRNYLIVMRYLSHPCPENAEDEHNSRSDKKHHHGDRRRLSHKKHHHSKSKNSKKSKKHSEDSPKTPPKAICQYIHPHTSHLFWGGATKDQLPIGDATLAHVALGQLGIRQLSRAQDYLNMLWKKDYIIPTADVNEPIMKEGATKNKHPSTTKKEDKDVADDISSVLNSPEEEPTDTFDVHEVYHNLRKEVRSFLDEVNFFGTLILPDTVVRPEALKLMAKKRRSNEEATEGSILSLDVLTSEEGGPDANSTDVPPLNITVPAKQDIGPQLTPPLKQNSEPPPHTSIIDKLTMNARQRTFDALSALEQTTSLLGKLNDHYVAYESYVKSDSHHGDQVRLMDTIQTEWNSFRWWAGRIKLNDQIEYLKSRMAIAEPINESRDEVGIQVPKHEGDESAEGYSENDSAQEAVDVDADSAGSQSEESNVASQDTNAGESGLLSFGAFLENRKHHPTSHIVIGNDAGDADSIISAITLSFIESVYSKNTLQSTAIVSIPREKFERERPEVNLLFNLAGMQAISDKLLFIEDLIHRLKTAGTHLSLTLVDHNTVNTPLHKYREKETIIEIVDHHEDESQYRDTCSGENRTVAFNEGVALVASTCTLVSERLRSSCKGDCRYPEPLALLLLGVILLDSVNLDQSVGKVTERDRNAVSDLVEHTNWNFSESKTFIVSDGNGGKTVNTDILFDIIQRAKYEPSFWNSLSVNGALSLDYKSFNVLDKTFGIASILMPGGKFIATSEFAQQTKDFMHARKISFLGIMFAFYESASSDVLKRQLALCAIETIDLDSLVNDLMSSQAYNDTNLSLQPSADGFSFENDSELRLQLFDQTNIQPSRKQIGPLLQKVYESYLYSTSIE